MDIDVELLEKIICLNCNSPMLQQANNALICVGCDTVIPLNNGIPDFLSVKCIGELTWKDRNIDCALNYEKATAQTFKPYRLERIDKPILRYVKGDVLEIGCGTGRLAKMVEQYGARYFGLDPVLSFLLYACRQHGLTRLVRGQGEKLPFRNESFDCIISGFYAYRYVKPELGLPEARRVLKSGGKFIFDLLNHWLIKLMEIKNLIRRAELKRLCSFQWHPSSDTFDFISVSQLQRMLKENGFLIEELISTPIIPIAIFSFIDLNQYLSKVYFRGKKTIHLGYDIIVTLKAI